MATTTIPWGDGSGDNIYLTYDALQGNQTVLVTSDANGGSSDRTQTITFTASHHGTSDIKILTVVQEGVPEAYIVFADPVVEQICATKWGDGIGIKPSQAALVTYSQLGTTFKDNTDITSFDEFQYFTGVKRVNDNAFGGCTALESIVLPSSIEYIYAPFRGCTSLTRIEINDGAAFRTAQPFQNDTALSEITFRGQATFINYCFQTCTNLHRVNIPDITTWFSFAHGGVQTVGYYSNEVHLYLIGSNTEITNVVIPDTITTIQQYACYACIGITSLTIPSAVTSIGGYAFSKCTGLSSIAIPSTVSSLGNNIINDCSGLTDVRILSNISISTDVLTTNNSNSATVGNGTGEFYCAGSITNIRYARLHGFKRVVIVGSATMSNGSIVSTICEIVKIGGDFDVTANTYGFGNGNALEFIEVNGNIICNGSTNVVSSAFNPTNCIAHFGYDGLIAQFSSVGRMSRFMDKMQKVYVGDGSSASHDNAVLAQYTSDTNWSAYSAKLDTWYNYINDPNANQDYIN